MSGLFLLYFAVQSRGYFDSTDSEGRYMVFRALVTTGTAHFQPRWSQDLETSVHSIGPSLAAAPFFGLGRLYYLSGLTDDASRHVMVSAALVSTMFYTALWMGLVAVLVYQFRRSWRVAFVCAIITGTATLIFPYSKSFQSENLVGLCATATVLGLIRYRRTASIRWCFAAGCAYGFGLVTKSELSLGFPFLLMYMANAVRGRGLDRRRLFRRLTSAYAALGAGILPGVAIVIWYNYVRFGSISRTGYEELGFTYPFVSGLYLIWLSSGKGLLWYCPILLVTLPEVSRFTRRWTAEAVLMFGWWAVMIFLYAKWHSPTGETSLGPRFTVSYLPFAVIPAVVASEDWSRTRRLAATDLLVLSLALQIVHFSTSYLTYFHSRFHAVAPELRAREVSRMHFYPPLSPLVGNLDTLRSGTLDMRFICNKPVEGELLISRPFWFLVAGSTGLLALGWLYARRLDGIAGMSLRRRYLCWTPAAGLALLGVAGAGAPGASGLEVRFERPGHANLITYAHRIDIPNMAALAESSICGAKQYRVIWSGWIRIPEEGLYGFRLKTPNAVNLRIGNKPVLSTKQLPAAESVLAKESSVALSPGWQPLSLEMEMPGWVGQVSLKWRPPGGEKYQSLKNAELRHRPPGDLD